MSKTKNSANVVNSNSALVAFREKLNAVTEKQIAEYQTALIAEFAERLNYETRKTDAFSDAQSKNFDNCKSKAIHSATVRVALVADVKSSRINYQTKSNSRLYLYSLLHENEFANALVRSNKLNATCYHIAKALVACADNNVEFTHKLAIAVLDKTQALDANISKLFARHYHSASTASAQASMCMTALRSLNIVVEYQNEDKKQCYKLADTEIARAFVEYVRNMI